MNTNRSADRLIMDRTNKILIDLRAKPKTGIHRYASCLLNQQDFYSAPYQDSFSNYRTPGRISPLSAIQRFLYECIFLPFLLKKTKNCSVPLYKKFWSSAFLLWNKTGSDCTGSDSSAPSGIRPKPTNTDLLLLEYPSLLCCRRPYSLHFSIYGK